MVKKKKVKENKISKKRVDIKGFGMFKGSKPFVRDEKILEGDDRFL